MQSQWGHLSRVESGEAVREERERERTTGRSSVCLQSGLILDSKLITGGIMLTGGGVRFHRLQPPRPIGKSCSHHVTRLGQWEARKWGVVSFMSSERRAQSGRIKYCELTRLAKIVNTLQE